VVDSVFLSDGAVVGMAVKTAAVRLSTVAGETDLTPCVFLIELSRSVRGGSVAGELACFFCWSSGAGQADDRRDERQRHGRGGPEGEQQGHDRRREPDCLAALRVGLRHGLAEVAAGRDFQPRGAGWRR
jgi:hypothetical protein